MMRTHSRLRMRNGFAFSPLALFTAGEQGVWYDPSDLGTLFQDSAGTVPVTAAGQPVGLMLDKRMSAGAELVPHPLDFTNAAWATAGTLSAVTSSSLTNASGAGAGKQLSVLVVGKKYEIIASYTKSDAVTVFQILAGAGQPDAPQGTAASGVYRSITTAVSPALYVRLAGNTTLTLTSLSVRELPGNHATQPTAASRPTLRQSPILGPELLADSNNPATWAIASAIVTSDSGGIRVTNSGAFFGNVQRSFPTVVGATYHVAAAYRTGSPAGTGSLNIGTSAGGNQILSGVSASADRVFVATTPTTHVTYFAGGNTAGNYSVYVNISVREITGYYTDRNYLETDGSDDWMSTNPIDFTGTDKVSVFTGVRKLSDATRGTLLELSTTVGNNGTFLLSAPFDATNQYRFTLHGSGANINDKSITSGYAAPTSDVIVAAFDTASGSASTQITTRLDGVAVEGSATIATGAGNFGNYPLYLFRRGGTTLPFSGHFYGLTIVGRLCTAVETRNAELLYANKVGVILA